MGRFILWSASFNHTSKELSFFATALQSHELYRGTHEMVAEMLNDLDLPDTPFASWRLRRFMTNYMTDYPESDDWHDIWLPTWEISITLLNPIDLIWDETDVVRTWASDATWNPGVPRFPVECIVVANFETDEDVTVAASVLNSMNAFIKGDLSIDALHHLAPDIFPRLFENLKTIYAEEAIHQEQPLSPLTVSQREGLTKQLIISFGLFKESFFREWASLAEIAIGLIRDGLYGVTNWNEYVAQQLR